MQEALQIRTRTQSVGSVLADWPESQSGSDCDGCVIVSARIMHLIGQAMAKLETDRQAVWSCLKEASMLLGSEADPLLDQAPQRRSDGSIGLPRWQALKALTYIDKHLGSKIHVQDLATHANMSKSHFSRAFKHRVGLAPMEYVIRKRVERAQQLILGSRQSLTQVALACGFTDQAHLSRRFRDQVGLSPGRWRRSK